ncbi:MAG: hypothetical protein IJ462_02785 [Clostridia bacterium]|nr:hypothetical protein [Clostridia bacterium]
MLENKKVYDKNDVIVLVLKLLLGIAAVAAAVVAGIKIYEKIQSKRICSLCDCCDDDMFCDDDDLCCCDDCDCEDVAEDFAETVAEVTEKEINPTEN